MKNLTKNQLTVIFAVVLVLVIIVVMIVAIMGKDSKQTGGSQTITTESTNSEALTEADTENSSETEGSQETETTTETGTETQITESEDTESEDTESDVPQNPDMYSTESGYKVYDPYNTRGLSTEKIPYGFGFAGNEQRPELSVNNQNRFDSYNGVDALALDLKSTEKVIYLTFDCGYEYNNNSIRILDILKEKNVKAAFFCTLDFIQDCPVSVQRMIDEGHIVGNHSTTHPVFPDISRNQMASELYGVDKYMQETYGYKMKYFRFPTGAYSENALELCTSVGYKSIFWSIAYDDWDTANQKGYDYGFEKVTSRLHPGTVILLHSISNDNVSILADFIDYAQQKGYKFVTLDDYKW